MCTNDISIRPAKHEILIGGIEHVNYGSSKSDSPSNRVRRTQAFVLRAQSTSSVVWPGSFIELNVPSDIGPEDTVAIEPKHDSGISWIKPQVIESVGGCIRIANETQEP